MKQSSQIRKEWKTQNRHSLADAMTGVFSPFFQIPIEALFTSCSVGQNQCVNIFMIQNKGNGPPGGWSSPEADDLPVPDYSRAACNGSLKGTKQKWYYINQNQFSKIYYKPIFYYN